jgi:hypothetical protein
VPALSHQVAQHEQHRAVLEAIDAFMAQRAAPSEFTQDGVALVTRIPAFERFDEVKETFEINAAKCGG